jgi:hypothetical protein
MISKYCIICKIEKPIDMYYKHPNMADGHLNKCKDCTKMHTREREKKITSTAEGIEQERKRHREKYYRLNYREKHKPTKEKKSAAMKKHIEKYPEKKKARIHTNKMKKTKGNHLHHWSYKEEHYKDVIELTISQHSLAHRHIIYDQERMMYRRIDNMQLLDTKEKHIEYISNLPF